MFASIDNEIIRKEIWDYEDKVNSVQGLQANAIKMLDLLLLGSGHNNPHSRSTSTLHQNEGRSGASHHSKLHASSGV